MSKRFSARNCVTISCEQQSVTGSCEMLTYSDTFGEKKHTLIDCGIFQGRDEDTSLNDEFRVIKDIEKIDNVLVTHSHVDHCGRLPLLGKMGFSGQILASNAAKTLMKPAILDTYKIEKLRWQKQGVPQKWNDVDMIKVFTKIRGVEYYHPINLCENAAITLIPNGHMVGASQILFQLKENGYDDVNILFTGDYNNQNLFFDVPHIPQHILNLPITIVTESTYGSSKTSETEANTQFEDNIAETLQNGGRVCICALAQERTELVLYRLKRMQQTGLINSDIPIVLDGNLSKTYLSLYSKVDLGIKETMKDFIPENFRVVADGEDRQSIIADTKPIIIVTSSGMGSNGPAPEYILKFMRNKNNLIQFTSYLPEGTAGRILQNAVKEKAKVITVFGRIVEAPICKIGFSTEFSSHAKADILMENINQFKRVKSIVITHGSSEKKQAFAEYLMSKLHNGLDGKCPPLFDLNCNNILRIYSDGVGKVIRY